MRDQDTQTIDDEIRTLEAVEVHVRTNQGTYGANECCRRVGTGDPAYGNREVYVTVGGRVRETGPGESRAPGYMRDIGSRHLSELREQLARLKAIRREQQTSRKAR